MTGERRGLLGSGLMIVVKQLTFSVPGRTILVLLNFQPRPASTMCLLGENGSGEIAIFTPLSGLLRTAAGLRFGQTKVTKGG